MAAATSVPGTPMLVSLRKRIAKTKMCIHFVNGRCTRDFQCLFAHSEEELREPPDLYKTRLCPSFVTENWSCRNGNACRFAHGEAELRWTPEFYKTSLCPYWQKGNGCAAGEFCRWAHGAQELRRRKPWFTSSCQPPESPISSRGSESLVSTTFGEAAKVELLPQNSKTKGELSTEKLVTDDRRGINGSCEHSTEKEASTAITLQQTDVSNNLIKLMDAVSRKPYQYGASVFGDAPPPSKNTAVSDFLRRSVSLSSEIVSESRAATQLITEKAPRAAARLVSASYFTMRRTAVGSLPQLRASKNVGQTAKTNSVVEAPALNAAAGVVAAVPPTRAVDQQPRDTRPYDPFDDTLWSRKRQDDEEDDDWEHSGSRAFRAESFRSLGSSLMLGFSSGPWEGGTPKTGAGGDTGGRPVNASSSCSLASLLTADAPEQYSSPYGGGGGVSRRSVAPRTPLLEDKILHSCSASSANNTEAAMPLRTPLGRTATAGHSVVQILDRGISQEQQAALPSLHDLGDLLDTARCSLISEQTTSTLDQSPVLCLQNSCPEYFHQRSSSFGSTCLLDEQQASNFIDKSATPEFAHCATRLLEQWTTGIAQLTGGDLREQQQGSYDQLKHRSALAVVRPIH